MPTQGARGLPPKKLRYKKPGRGFPGPSRVINEGPDGRMRGSKAVQVGYPIGGGRSRGKGKVAQ